MPTPNDYDLLTGFFDSEMAGEEALDAVASLGFITAQVISPAPFPASEWLTHLLGETAPELTESERAELNAMLERTSQEIDRGFQESDEDAYSLPMALELGDEPDESDLRSWCVGFLLGQMEQEEAWFSKDEHFVSELLLPLMVISGLFREEGEIAEIEADTQLVDDMCLQLPEVLTELYLHFQAPEEKSAPKFGGKAAKGKQGFPGNKKRR